jgi:hypothetical protein
MERLTSMNRGVYPTDVFASQEQVDQWMTEAIGYENERVRHRAEPPTIRGAKLTVMEVNEPLIAFRVTPNG